ncbi:hypothetical protein EDC04DRAFT_2907562 [Pisolithus marmoratus]|nr:hypothetical protein EDC04DRAFT_2907562 [Pisolithus marmoratus]
MPSKRRTPAKAPASAAPKAIPAPTKDTPPTPAKATPAPVPPPPPPVETPATKVRREWQKFIVSWYRPEKKKLEEQLQKELTTKYKKSGSSKAQQKAKAAELDEKLSMLAKQLAEPARNEWERRLEAAQLREDQWDDMTSEEQQAVMGVFVGFFGEEDDEDVDDDDDAEDDQVVSADPLSLEADESAIQDQSEGFASLPRAKPSPLFSTNTTFQFVNPTSLFVEGASPPHPATTLPSLSMDHLATLGTSHTGRPVDPSPMNASSGSVPSFHSWASEAGLTVHQPQMQTSQPTSQTLGLRPSATDGLSRQTSAMSTISSPPLFSNKSSPPQSSPPIQSTKASPSAINEALPLGKRYIGPTILDDDEPLDENLLKSKMAAEYEEFKYSLRIQMIYDFHMEAAEMEIKLVEMLTNEGTKDSRAKAVQEHEMHMMALREHKEEERKRRCAEERERRREEHRAALRSIQGKDVDPSSGRKGAPPKSSDKSVPPKGPTVSQKENVPVHPLTASTSGSGLKLEPPSILQKSASVLTEAEVSSNEAIFAEAAALLVQGRLVADGPAVPQPPQCRKRTNSTCHPNHQIPQITVNFVDPPSTVPATPAVLTSAAKGKKTAKKGQAAASKPAALSKDSDRPDIDAEPPPPLGSWGASISRGVWGNSPKISAEESDPDAGTSLLPTLASSMTTAWDTTKKPNSGKKSKTVTFTDDVGDEDEAAPVAPCEPKPPKSTRSAVNGKHAKKTVPVVEEQTPRGPTKVTPQSSNVKKPGNASATSTANRRPKAAVVSEELEGVEEEVIPLSTPTPSSQQTSTKAAWSPIPAAQIKVATSQPGSQPLRGMEASRSKSTRVETVPEPNDTWGMFRGGGGANMPGALEDEEVLDESDEDDDWLDKENAEYWNKFIGVNTEKQTAETSTVPATHLRWMPSADRDSDGEDDPGDGGDELGGESWMQYAISGGEVPGLDATIEPEAVSAQRTPELNVWERGKTKKGGRPNDDAGKSSSTFGKTTLQGAPWPMENWLSSSSRVGQSSGSAKFL